MKSTKNISLVTIVNAMAHLQESFQDRCLNLYYEGVQLKDVINDCFLNELELEIIDLSLLQKLDLEDMACETIESLEKYYQVYDL